MPVKQDTFIYLVLTVAILMQYQCAVRKAPPGGPEDKTAPIPMSVFPTSDSTNIESLDYIEIVFDEDINRQSIQNQIWLLPELEAPLEFEWQSNRHLRVALVDSLEPDQTYILTIGTGLKDLRSNNLEEPIVIPFSTGADIDQGFIEGMIEGEDVEGTFIYAYEMVDSISVDSMLSQRPRYYSQVNRDGAYRLGYLRHGRYRLFALDDANADRQYTIQVDRIGLPSADVVLDSVRSFHASLNFALIREDTLPPRLVRASAATANLVKLEFNEPVKNVSLEHLSISDTLSGATLGLLGVSPDPVDPLVLNLYTERQTESSYGGAISEMTDSTGNRISAPMPFYFTGLADLDTAEASLLQNFPADGMGAMDLGTTIRLIFSAPLDSASFQGAGVVFDQDSNKVNGAWLFQNLQVSEFTPDSLEFDNQYRVVLDATSLSTIFETTFIDSTYSFSFKTQQLENLGEIEGRIQVDDTTKTPLILELNAFAGGKSIQRTAYSDSLFLLGLLPEGQYRLRVTIDEDGNGRQNYGSTRPFHYAEPFFFYPDTVNVRKRWTTEGIYLRM